MTDQLTFERELTNAFERYLAAAPTEVNARALAATIAIQPARRPTSVDHWLARPMRMVLVTAAVLLAIALAIAGAGGLHLLQPKPQLGGQGWDAIYLRSRRADAAFIDVVAVRSDGHERLVRQISRTLPGLSLPAPAYGKISRQGWLAIGASNPTPPPSLDAYALFDLSDPDMTPLVVRYPAVMSGQWSSSGLFALSSDTPASDVNAAPSWMYIDVFDPETGGRTHLGQCCLFGGGPSLVWAWDGSGLLSGDQLKPVDGGPPTAIDPGLGFDDRRVGLGGRVIAVCNETTIPEANPAGWCPVGMRAVVVGDEITLESQRWYTSMPRSDTPIAAVFAANGRSVLVLSERVIGSNHRAVIVRVDDPDKVTELISLELPANRSPNTFAVDPADSQFALDYRIGNGDAAVYEIGPIVHLDGSTTPPPTGAFAGYVDAAVADSWPGMDPPFAAPSGP